MSLLLFEGFSGWSDASFDAHYAGSNIDVASTANARTPLHDGGGGGVADMTGTAITWLLGSQFSTTDDVCILGFGFRKDHGGAVDGQQILEISDGGSTCITLEADYSAETWTVKDSTGTAIGTTSGTSIVQNTWYYIEIVLTVHATSGAVELWIDGVQELDLSGEDTDGAGTTQYDEIEFSVSNNSYDYWLDDAYLCDSAGSANNARLGPVEVFSLTPNGDGNYAQWDGSDGNQTSNWQLIDDQDAGGTDYIESPDVGDKDSWTMRNLPSGSPRTIVAVRPQAHVYRAGGGTNDMRFFFREGGADYPGADLDPGATDERVTAEVHETNPNSGSAWTETEVNAMELGVEVRSG